MSDDDLVAMYTSDYNLATTTYDPLRADYVAAQETIMTELGIPIPDGNRTAADIRTDYET